MWAPIALNFIPGVGQALSFGLAKLGGLGKIGMGVAKGLKFGANNFLGTNIGSIKGGGFGGFSFKNAFRQAGGFKQLGKNLSPFGESMFSNVMQGGSPFGPGSPAALYGNLPMIGPYSQQGGMPSNFKGLGGFSIQEGMDASAVGKMLAQRAISSMESYKMQNWQQSRVQMQPWE